MLGRNKGVSLRRAPALAPTTYRVLETATMRRGF
eukprot:SAG22_NODE_15465_length_348_cov_0.835341_1_plen_33_part_10